MKINNKICPFSSAPCVGHVCEIEHLCVRSRYRPIELMNADYSPALHFVGFCGEEYNSAVRVFGTPDFIHRSWDLRALTEIAPLDTVVFAKGSPNDPPGIYSFDDSSQPDDPAELERRK